MAGKTLLVLGSEGWIGRAVSCQAREQGFTVQGFDLELGQDALDITRLRQAMGSVDFAINCMGKVREAASRTNPHRYWRNNLMAAVNVFEVAKGEELRVVHVSSAAYGWWDNPYAASKSAADIAAHEYQMLAADIVIVRLHNPYGPEQPMDFAVPSMMRRIAKQNTISVGKNTRDYIYIDDVAKLLLKALDSEEPLWEVGNGVPVTDMELALSIGEAIGEEPRFAGSLPNFSCRTAGEDAHKGEVTLKEGLLKTWHWLRPQL